jgi:signal transduction histidine kinase
MIRPPDWWSKLVRVPYREVLNSPGIARAHDLQRVVSYGLGVIVALVVEIPTWRAVAVLTIAGVLLLVAVERLITGRRIAPYLLAQVDQTLASVAVALATASPLITFAVVVFISASITASFAAPGRMAAVAAVATALPAMVTSVAVVSPDQSANDYLAAFVLILLMLALAGFILIFFTLQARQLRRELSSREKQLSAVLEVTPVALATVDQSGQITTLAGDLPGWAELAEEKLGADSDLNLLVSRAVLGEPVRGEISFGGRTFTVSCNPGNTGKTLLTAYDVSEQAEARKRLEELVRAKDQFIAAVSHELRTPLSAVLGFAEVVRDSMADDDTLQPMIGEVADQSAEMAAIIDDLLVAARSSFESVPTAPRIINMASEAAAVAETIGPRLNHEPVFEMQPTEAFADPIRVRQIVRNLLTNADRYGGNEIRIRTNGNGSRAVLQVCDDGIPLRSDLRERIFEPYESSGPVRGQPAAMGLGLAVSRTLAELMGGSISYDHDGKWSIFELQLPRTERTAVNVDL